MDQIQEFIDRNDAVEIVGLLREQYDSSLRLNNRKLIYLGGTWQVMSANWPGRKGPTTYYEGDSLKDAIETLMKED